MSSETPFIVGGASEAPNLRARRPSPSRKVPLLLLAGSVVLVLLVADITLWFSAHGRSDQAVEETVREAQALRDREVIEARAAAEKAAASKKRRGEKPKPSPAPPAPRDDLSLAAITAQNQALSSELAGYQPEGVYIVIDTANNRLFMKNGRETLLDALCSTGSYSRLDAPDGRSWFFHTPRGKFKVQKKIKDPVWVKPDWAFIELQEPIPGARHPDRYEPYVMGDYALAFGNGYYIHGTLYRRLIGQSVTHGCVRLGDQELEQVFKTAEIGTPIFIY